MVEKETQKTSVKESEEVKSAKKAEIEKISSRKKELENQFISTQKELEEVDFEIAQLERLFALKTYKRQLNSRLSSLNEEYRSLDK